MVISKQCEISFAAVDDNAFKSSVFVHKMAVLIVLDVAADDQSNHDDEVC